MDPSGSHLAEARDVGAIARANERGRAFHDLTSASRRENYQGEAVVFAIDTIFHGYSSHDFTSSSAQETALQFSLDEQQRRKGGEPFDARSGEAERLRQIGRSCHESFAKAT